MASSSLGWEANAELQLDHSERAIELYLQQMATGDPTAVWSLRLVAARIVKVDETLRRAARDENSRRIVTAYLLAQGGPRQSDPGSLPGGLTQRWLGLIESVSVTDVAGADRLAWVAYQAGDFAAAMRWLERAPAQSGITHWIRAKLLLRAGKGQQAASELGLAVHGFPQDEHWDDLSTDFADGVEESRLSPADRALGELGILRLSRRQYVEALDALLLRAKYWMDSAYVAERVLTIDELVQYVATNWPEPSPEIEEATLGSAPEWPGWSPEMNEDAYQHETDLVEAEDARRAELRAQGETNVRIRHLLARRLARAERWPEARSFFPRRYQAKFDAYVENLRVGRDEAQPQANRAHALWKAAQLARYDGMELLGTELEPDWYTADEGNFELPAISDARGQQGSDKLTASSADERKRVRTTAVAGPRWHYRYVATNLAWQTAELMPNESDDTAHLLCEAGSWLKARDPMAADRFYKALVRRCGKTELGRQAEQLHWFPRLLEAGDR